MVGDRSGRGDVPPGQDARRHPLPRGLVAVVVGALVVVALAALGLRALAPFADPYHRRPLLLVGPLDAGEAQVALWALVWLGACTVASVAVVLSRRVTGRLRVPGVVVSVVAAGALGVVAVGTVALLVVQWALTPTYARLPVTDADGRRWVVAEHSNGFAPTTSWRVYRGGPFAYDEVPALEQEVQGRLTPIADGEYSVRVGADGTPVLRFDGAGPHEVPLR